MGRPITVALAIASLAGCGDAAPQPFPDHEVLWVDEDTRPFPGPPEEIYISYLFDGVDNTLLRPLAEVVTPELDREASNVNALDEVPSSSWYENRLAVREMTPAEIARGACDDVDEDAALPTPWTIVSGKPDGSSRGFVIEDGSGQRHLLKPDGPLQPERQSAADAIAASIWHAAGFHVPCNRVVYVDRDALVLGPDAEVEHLDGTRAPLTDADVEAVLEHAVRTGDGRYRFGASQFVDGEPVSHWRYRGVRGDDPNDVVPHEDRRELRAQYVLSAWTNHIDARAENTMAAWIETGDDRGYLRHYVIDFGDAFGVIHESESLSRRFGHSHYFDVEHLLVDLVTLGRIERPWDDATYGPAGVTLGYYGADDFEADAWRPGYPNPAYDRMTEADAAWMARIVARFDDDDIDALVARGRFTDPRVADELARILRARRDRILERWLTRLSPLAWPTVTDVDGTPHLCAQDLALRSGLRNPSGRRYRASARPSIDLSAPLRTAADTLCQPLPRDFADPLVLDLVASSEGAETTGPLRVHLRADPTWHIVGLERPASDGDEAREAREWRDAVRELRDTRPPDEWCDVAPAVAPEPGVASFPKRLEEGYAVRRPVPDYDGRPPAPEDAADELQHVVRGLLEPVRDGIDAVVRAPLAAVLRRVEQSESMRRWTQDA